MRGLPARGAVGRASSKKSSKAPDQAGEARHARCFWAIMLGFDRHAEESAAHLGNLGFGLGAAVATGERRRSADAEEIVASGSLTYATHQHGDIGTFAARDRHAARRPRGISARASPDG